MGHALIYTILICCVLRGQRSVSLHLPSSARYETSTRPEGGRSLRSEPRIIALTSAHLIPKVNFSVTSSEIGKFKFKYFKKPST